MRVAALAIAVLALAAAPAALGEPATSAEVHALARAAAAGDQAALARLRSIDVVDGAEMPLGQILAARGESLDGRLRTLAAGAEGSAPAAGAPAEAKRILEQRRYRGSEVPRPLHGVLAWLGERLSWLGRKLAWPVDRVGEHTPGGARFVWVVLAALVLLGVALAVARISVRRGGVQIERAGASRRDRPEAPEALEREADAAERAGELAVALRLRFRAGLLRLAGARVIPLRGSIRTGEVRRTLRSRDFDELARAFDEVVYGGRPARADDLATAKTVWPRVLEAAKPR